MTTSKASVRAAGVAGLEVYSIRHALPWLAPILDRLEVGVVLIQDGRVQSANEAFAQLLGMRTTALEGMPADCFVSHVARRTSDEPESLSARGLLPSGARAIVCDEFEITRPSRSVVRWVAHEIELPSGPAALVICTDVTVEVDLLTAQERLAVTDRLTGLMNRRGADSVLSREMARADRFGTCLSFVMLDVDHFKSINDGHGHATGDRMLCLIGQILTEQLRTIDVAIRWGGEEFLVVLPNTALAGAHICAERVRVALSCIDVAHVGRLTLSAGLAERRDGETLDSVLARADTQLYEAKAAGRDCVR